MGEKIGEDIADEMLSGQKDVVQTISALAETCRTAFSVVDSRNVADVHIVSKQKRYDRLQGI